MSETEALEDEILTKPKTKRAKTPEQIEQFKQMVAKRKESIAKQKKEKQIMEAKILLAQDWEQEQQQEIIKIPVRKQMIKKELIDSDTDTEQEIIVVKKKKKPKKTTVIMDDSDTDSEEPHHHPSASSTRPKINQRYESRVDDKNVDRFRSQSNKSNIKVYTNVPNNLTSFFI